MATSNYVPLKIPQGEIQGVKNKSIYGAEYYSFLGIPYGKPPIGELRFKAPLTADGWDGVRDCTKAGNKPVQVDVFSKEFLGSEDCLYLNVFTKTLQSPQKLPVMIYIHGGGYENGFANDERDRPDYFMWKNIVLVTFNYRLGALGFLTLSTPELGVPGNAGLKDMVLAIKWVNQNIVCFNGDPDNVTVFGGSAGANATHIMMTTKCTKNLFHKAILQSGCMLNPWSHLPQSDMHYRLAKANGYKGEHNETSILNFLMNLPAQNLVDKILLTDNDRDKGILYPFAPAIEPYKTEDCVIHQPYVTALKTAWGNNIPLIIGGTSFEGLVCYPLFKQFPHKLDLFKNDPQALLPMDIQSSGATDEKKADMTQIIMRTHFGEKPMTMENLMELLDVFSIRYFWLGIYDFIEFRLFYAKTAPTFVYRFDFDSAVFAFRRFMLTNYEVQSGVAHADELQYLFHYKDAWKLDPDDEEYITIRRMIGMWTAFAQNSNPNCSEISDNTISTATMQRTPASEASATTGLWQNVTDQNLFMCLNISNEITFCQIPERYKIEVWKNLYN